MTRHYQKGFKGLAYLASPYKDYYAGSEAAFHDVCVIAGHLVQAGMAVYSPIAHCHPIAVHTGMTLHNYELWMPLVKLMLDRCDMLIIAQMLGWQDSQGIKEETAYFTGTHKPIYYLDIRTLCMKKIP